LSFEDLWKKQQGVKIPEEKKPKETTEETKAPEVITPKTPEPLVIDETPKAPAEPTKPVVPLVQPTEVDPFASLLSGMKTDTPEPQSTGSIGPIGQPQGVGQDLSSLSQLVTPPAQPQGAPKTQTAPAPLSLSSLAPSPSLEGSEEDDDETGLGAVFSQQTRIDVRQFLPEVKVETVPDDEFDYSEDEGTGAEIITIYGDKGTGKTMLAMTKGRDKNESMDVLSFDKMAAPIKQLYFSDDKVKNEDGIEEDRIHVYNCIKYLRRNTREAYLVSCETVMRYSFGILDNIVSKRRPDWIVVDAGGVLNQIAEMTMRARNNLLPFQGIKNRNIWKERTLYLDQIHTKCVEYSKKGVIYTFYPNRAEIMVEGEVVDTLDNPKWIGSILEQTHVVIKVESQVTKGKETRFVAYIKSSKKGHFKTGAVYDITGPGKGFKALEVSEQGVM